MQKKLSISYLNHHFIAYNSFGIHQSLRSHGWTFEVSNRTWQIPGIASPSTFIAIREFLNFMDDAAARQAQCCREFVEQRIAASQATDAEIAIPAPQGQTYLPFQRAGISFLLGQEDALLGDEMGLGKTIQAIGVANADPHVDSVLVVCPASLKLNWQTEFQNWSTRGWNVAVAGDKKKDPLLESSQVVIINYELLQRYKDALASREWGLLVLDEAHYLKNKSTKRASAVFGVSKSQAISRILKKHIPADERMFIMFPTEKEAALGRLMDENPGIKEELERLIQPGLCGKRRIFITGTPIPNRPIELFPLLEQLDPSGLGADYRRFADRYCNAKMVFGHLDTRGASNLDELQLRLRAGCMVRRLKKDVLPDLPPKFRQIVEVEATGSLRRLAKAEIEAEESHAKNINSIRAQLAKYKEEASADYKSAVSKLRQAENIHLAEMSRIRRELAVAKIPEIIAHIHDIFKCGCEKLVVMIYHSDVAVALVNAFPKAAVLTGDTPTNERHAEVERFNTQPECKLFIGSIKAAGVGINLQIACNILFAEQDWTPGNMLQAEDRCHRHGQTDNVLVQILVVDGSLDAKMAKNIAKKADAIDRALDGELQEVKLIEPKRIRARRSGSVVEATEDRRPEEVVLSPERIQAVHQCLQLLANGDPDGATKINGVGFNKFDGTRGHQLATLRELSLADAQAGLEIIRKYKRQLPKDVYHLAAEPALLATEPIAQGKKHARGRPKLYVDQPPPSATERSKRSLRALKASGGKALLLRLSRESYEALRAIMAAEGHKEEAKTINQMLIAKRAELKS